MKSKTEIYDQLKSVPKDRLTPHHKKLFHNFLSLIHQENIHDHLMRTVISTGLYPLPFEAVNATHINKGIKFTAQITNIKQPQPMLHNTLFECKSCMRGYTMIQYKEQPHHLPERCEECGGKSFKIIEDESSYTNVQHITVSTENTSKELEVILYEQDAIHDKYNVGDTVEIEGFLEAHKQRSKFTPQLHCINIKVKNTTMETPPALSDDSRNSVEYQTWRTSVLNRDKHCQICGGNKHLEAHHIFGYKENPSLRLDTNNGVTICSFCHNKYHSYYGHSNVNPVDLIKFMNQFGTVRRI